MLKLRQAKLKKEQKMKKNIFKKVLPYKMRNAAMALAATVAGMTTTSCEKEDDILPEQPKIQKVTKVVEVAADGSVVSMLEELGGWANDSTVEKIVCKATGDWSSYNSEAVTFFNRTIVPKMDHVAKGKWIGEGDLNYKLGEATKVADDSLGIVKRGFTINAQKSR